MAHSLRGDDAAAETWLARCLAEGATDISETYLARQEIESLPAVGSRPL